MESGRWRLTRFALRRANPRVDDCVFEALAEMIRTLGLRWPIVFGAKNIIIARQTCLKAAIHRGMTRVPLNVTSDLSPEQARALRLADNRMPELAS